MAVQNDNQQNEMAPAASVQEGSGNQAKNVLGSEEHPIMLSTILGITSTITDEAKAAFIRKSQDLFMKKKTKTNYEKEWLKDYMEHQEMLFTASAAAPDQHQQRNASLSSLTPSSDGTDRDNEFEPAVDQQSASWEQVPVKPADLNKLFVKPETFDGIKPPPRQWLDQYEKAAISNGWSDAAKAKYLTTFLKETAYAWLNEVVPLQTSRVNNWTTLRALFVKCYMGESDRLTAKRELDRAIQKEGEKAAEFIPRIMQMIKTVDPNRQQETITDDIRHKLLPEYQEKLIMFELKTLRHLYDACTKIEAGLEASRAASRRREKTTQSSSVSSRATNHNPRVSSLDRKECFRCGRCDHWAKECTADMRIDGTPCRGRNGNHKSINMVAEHDDSSLRKNTVRNCDSSSAIKRTDRHYLCTVTTIDKHVQLAISGASLIKHEVECDGIALTALIDTGAFVSTVDSQIAADHNWHPKEFNGQLFNALGESMNCCGSVELNISLKIGDESRNGNLSIVVVENLCIPLILGLDAIRKLNVIINAFKKPPLSFRRQSEGRDVASGNNVPPFADQSDKTSSTPAAGKPPE